MKEAIQKAVTPHWPCPPPSPSPSPSPIPSHLEFTTSVSSSRHTAVKRGCLLRCQYFCPPGPSTTVTPRGASARAWSSARGKGGGDGAQGRVGAAEENMGGRTSGRNALVHRWGQVCNGRLLACPSLRFMSTRQTNSSIATLEQHFILLCHH